LNITVQGFSLAKKAISQFKSLSYDVDTSPSTSHRLLLPLTMQDISLPLFCMKYHQARKFSMLHDQ